MIESKKINIGCGNKQMPGYINLDSVALPGVDVVHNLNISPWPLKDNYFEEVYCDNVLEHLSSITKSMEEIWRICENKAKVKIIVPIFPSVWSFCDPTHKSIFTYFTFNYFRPEDGLNYYSKARFKILKRTITFNRFLKPLEWLLNKSEFCKKVWAFYFSHIFQADFLKVELEAIK